MPRAQAQRAHGHSAAMKGTAAHANFADKTAYDTGGIYTNHAHRTLEDGHAGLAPVDPSCQMHGVFMTCMATWLSGATMP